MAAEIYDLVIVGAGPAGYTASIYASRYKLKHAIVGELSGGAISESHKVCNYPTENAITGLALSQKMQQQALSYGVREIRDRVLTVTPGDNKIFSVKTNKNGELQARTVLLATGLERRRLDVSGEKELRNKGVAYCATCDGFLFQDKVVAVIGGSDAANTSALYLADIAKHVYQIYRGDDLRGEVAWIEQIKHNPKITTIFNTQVSRIEGENKVERLVLDKSFKGSDQLAVDGVFVEIGADPSAEFVTELGLERDVAKYIVTKTDQSTNVAGIFAAGDVTTGSNKFKQVITAASEGAIAAESAFHYCAKENNY